MAASDFKHVLLENKQIRLLTLNKTPGQISCTLTIHDFDECPDYFALSYAWGPPPAEREISLNGHKFMIRENLFNCLLSLLRKPHPPPQEVLGSQGNTAATSETENARFWIDQICIDQTNIPERNQQVSMMDQIYICSKETVVWVGTEEIDEIDFPYDPILSEIHTLFMQPYWTRLWIVQEILLSKMITVRHGDESYDWDLLESYGKEVARALAYENPDRHQDTLAWRRQGLFNGLPTATGCLFNEKSNVLAEIDGRKLSDLLERFGNSECENPLDKVYALQGLLKLQPRIKIDYSISPETLFYEVVDKIAKEEGDALMEEE
ncbi:Heterokaryon incompatibility protein (HET) domain containing protein [Hyaloscypha variabilis]